MPEPLLEVQDLSVRFRTRQGLVTAVDGLSFSVDAGEVLGVVGESGSGKSVSMLSVLRLLDSRNCEISGSIAFRGRELTSLSDKQMREVRGRDIAMVFQDPMTSLTPVYRAGWHLAEAITAHEKVSKKAARARAIELLEQVGIPDPARRIDDYPHQFSGGMRQRIVIAMALAGNPALLIADEPTTALDVTIQAQILDLMRRLQDEHGSAIVLITHDMGVIGQLADRVMVMYGGRAAEVGTRQELFIEPQHPYTWGLLGSVPRTDRPRTRRLAAIPGNPISPSAQERVGCVFSPRCAAVHDACRQTPVLTDRGSGHSDACWLPLEERAATRLRIEAESEASRS